mgnify:CR=1 FL=1|tara:strand:+ start:98 stop:340 length:243 start_codon:yes stop_codon:yes gene_type:complete
MSVSQETINKMCEAIIDDVAQYISEDPRFVDLLSEIVLDAIQSKLGKLEPKILLSLTRSISLRLRCSANYSEVFYPRCPL